MWKSGENMNVNVTIVKTITIPIPDEIADICDYVEKKTGLRCGSATDYAEEKPTIAYIVEQNGCIPYFEW